MGGAPGLRVFCLEAKLMGTTNGSSKTPTDLCTSDLEMSKNCPFVASIYCLSNDRENVVVGSFSIFKIKPLTAVLKMEIKRTQWMTPHSQEHTDLFDDGECMCVLQV